MKAGAVIAILSAIVLLILLGVGLGSGEWGPFLTVLTFQVTWWIGYLAGYTDSDEE